MEEQSLHFVRVAIVPEHLKAPLVDTVLNELSQLRSKGRQEEVLLGKLEHLRGAIGVRGR